MRSALETAHLVRNREISAREVVTEALERIDDDDFNALVDVDADGALAAADAVDPQALLCGVPVVVKANTDVAGLICDHGSAALADRRPERDAALVRRLREAGCIVLATSRLPEWGILPTTEPVHGGPVRNPWDPGRTAGGSSGGSAAAVAGGLVALAHANDGGGSIRIPAACCGLVGLKPSRGRVSRAPGGDSFLGVDGALTGTVLDAAAALDVLSGYEPGDPTWAGRPAEPFLHTTQRDPGPRRIAVSTANVLDAPLDPEHLRALRDTAAVLVELGHHVEEVELPLPPPEALGLFLTIYSASRATDMRMAPEGAAIEPLSAAVRDLAAGFTSVDYLATLGELQRMAREFIAFFAQWDLLMTPMLAERPLPHGTCHGGDPTALGRAGLFAPYAALFNISGQPALSLPAGVGPDGLPSAVQLIGRPLAEDLLLQVAFGIQALAPFQVAPGVPAAR